TWTRWRSATKGMTRAIERLPSARTTETVTAWSCTPDSWGKRKSIRAAVQFVGASSSVSRRPKSPCTSITPRPPKHVPSSLNEEPGVRRSRGCTRCGCWLTQSTSRDAAVRAGGCVLVPAKVVPARLAAATACDCVARATCGDIVADPWIVVEAGTGATVVAGGGGLTDVSCTGVPDAFLSAARTSFFTAPARCSLPPTMMIARSSMENSSAGTLMGGCVPVTRRDGVHGPWLVARKVPYFVSYTVNVQK